MKKFLVLLFMVFAVISFGDKLQVISDCCLYDNYWTKENPNTVIGDIKTGTVCEIMDVYGDYAHYYGGGVVWTKMLTINSNRNEAVVLGEGVSIRSNAKGPVIGQLSAGAKIFIDIIPVWYKIGVGQWVYAGRVKLIK